MTEEKLASSLYEVYIKAREPVECAFVLTWAGEVKCITKWEAKTYEFAHIGCPFYRSIGSYQKDILKEDLAFIARSFIRYLKANPDYLGSL